MKCPKCDADLKENSKFCSKCGNKIEVVSINNSNKSNFHPVFILIAIVAIILIVVVGSFAFFGFGNRDLVDVTGVEMSVNYVDTPFGGAVESAQYMEQMEMEDLQVLKETDPEQYELELESRGITDEEVENYDSSEINHTDYQVISADTKYSIMPKEDIARLTDFRLDNIIVTFENGDSENWGSFIYEPEDIYFKDNSYDFSFTKTIENSNKTIEEYDTITHIKADIVINTTDEINKVIGHLDNDITPNHY